MAIKNPLVSKKDKNNISFLEFKKRFYEKIKKIKIKSFASISGKLVPISFNKKFPIKVKRIFSYTLKK